jgi:hypothetical protein
MKELKIGEYYLFKTLGLFYYGRILKKVEERLRDTVILNDASLVVEVGETADMSQGIGFSYSEPFPPAMNVFVNMDMVYAVEGPLLPGMPCLNPVRYETRRGRPKARK